MRDEIAAAASTAPDIQVRPYYWQTTLAGTGFVRWAASARDSSGFGYMDTWNVVVLVPQDVAQGEAWIESHRDALVAAIEAIAVVTRISPAEFRVGEGAALNVLVLEVVTAR